ncbi:hypothetical protein VULLAG_LOCUS13732 [Vulpes lagopus]
MGQLGRKVHGVQAIQPPPRDVAAIQGRIPQLVAEALQLLLVQVLERGLQQLPRCSHKELHAAGAAASTGQVCRWRLQQLQKMNSASLSISVKLQEQVFWNRHCRSGHKPSLCLILLLPGASRTAPWEENPGSWGHLF